VNDRVTLLTHEQVMFVLVGENVKEHDQTFK
jgi:hypothetical protein